VDLLTDLLCWVLDCIFRFAEKQRSRVYRYRLWPLVREWAERKGFRGHEAVPSLYQALLHVLRDDLGFRVFRPKAYYRYGGYRVLLDLDDLCRGE